MSDDRIPRFGTKAMNQIEYSSRSFEVFKNSRQCVGGERSQLTGLRDDGISHDECWSKFPAQQIERKIPGSDQARDSDRLSQNITDRAGHLVHPCGALANQLSEKSEIGYGSRNI